MVFNCSSACPTPYDPNISFRYQTPLIRLWRHMYSVNMSSVLRTGSTWSGYQHRRVLVRRGLFSHVWRLLWLLLTHLLFSPTDTHTHPPPFSHLTSFFSISLIRSVAPCSLTPCPAHRLILIAQWPDWNSSSAPEDVDDANKTSYARNALNARPPITQTNI